MEIFQSTVIKKCTYLPITNNRRLCCVPLAVLFACELKGHFPHILNKGNTLQNMKEEMGIAAMLPDNPLCH